MKKILVIGGAYQGKTEWVQDNFQEYRMMSPEMLLQENRLGKLVSGVCINKFHMLIKQWIHEKRDYVEAVNLIRQNPSWLIVCDEVGNGVVPIDKEERMWREATGRMLCELAKDADEVYRMYCQIPVLIKGGEEACCSHCMQV